MQVEETGGRTWDRRNRALLRLGGLVFCLLSPPNAFVANLPGTNYVPFLASGGSRVHAFARLSCANRQLRWAGCDAGGAKPATAISRRFWQLGNRTVLLVRFTSGAQPVRLVAVYRRDFRFCHVFVSSPIGTYFAWRRLTYHWLSVLTANALARRGGLFLHASAIGVGDQGIAFVGASGRGKTTMATLWDDVPGTTILGEDMVCIRREGDGYRIYGLPWTGRRGLTSPKSFPLRAICFIEHAGQNWAADRDRASTAKDLFVQSMPSRYDREGTRAVLDSVVSVSERVPAYRLGFVPDRSVISYIENLLL